MDFTNIVLIQIAIFSCVATLLPSSRSNLSIKIAAIAVLTILAMSWAVVPQQMATIGIGAWIGLLLIPVLLMYRLESLVNSSKYSAASQLAKWLRWLLPCDGMWTYHHLLRGISLAQRGQIEAADEIFVRDRHKHLTEIGRSATALLYRSTDRWQEYINWFKDLVLPTSRVGETSALAIRNDNRVAISKLRGMTLVHYLRALAETGNLQGCIAEVAKLEQNQQINPLHLNLLRMYILAYCGQIEAVTLSYRGMLANYPAAVRQFWACTAELAAGNIDGARTQLVELQVLTDDRCIQQDITWRLSQPLPDLEKLTPADWEIVDRIAARTDQELKYGSQTPTDIATPATSLLIAINILVFCAEVGWQWKTGTPAGSFLKWGGLFAPLVMAGEWWRIIAANFLHLGILHLVMNMLALLYLGKFVEYRLGTLRFTIAYLLAGLGSMATITYIDTRWSVSPQFTVGASGAIMGILGTMGAIHLTGWRQAKIPSAARQFQAVLFSVGFQLIFDVTNGHTSIVGHFSGLIIGFLVGLVLSAFGTRLAE